MTPPDGSVTPPDGSVTPPPDAASTDLADELLRAGYTDLFLRAEPGAPGFLDRAGGEARLLALVRSDAAPSEARFLAAEVLFTRPGFPPDDLRATLAKVYGDALRHTAAGDGRQWLSANAWGLLYELDDAGPVGSHFVRLGEAAIPELTKLLGDTGLLVYEGSKEATVGNAYGYRIKDAAAFYLGRILGVPVKFHQDIAARDAEIDRLRKLAAARAPGAE